MSLHKQISFEGEICEHMAKPSWQYAAGDAALYDRQLALFPSSQTSFQAEGMPGRQEVRQRLKDHITILDVGPTEIDPVDRDPISLVLGTS